ncbi:hypothetical protein ACFL35_19935 [Candidatus Riflebacteria bacterium]
MKFISCYPKSDGNPWCKQALVDNYHSKGVTYLTPENILLLDQFMHNCIAVVPGFGFGGPAYQGFIRISYSTITGDSLQNAMQRFVDVLNNLGKG